MSVRFHRHAACTPAYTYPGPGPNPQPLTLIPTLILTVTLTLTRHAPRTPAVGAGCRSVQRVQCLPSTLVGCDAGRWRRAQSAVCGWRRARDTASQAAARRDGAYRALMTISTLVTLV